MGFGLGYWQNQGYCKTLLKIIFEKNNKIWKYESFWIKYANQDKEKLFIFVWDSLRIHKMMVLKSQFSFSINTFMSIFFYLKIR